MKLYVGLVEVAAPFSATRAPKREAQTTEKAGLFGGKLLSSVNVQGWWDQRTRCADDRLCGFCSSASAFVYSRRLCQRSGVGGTQPASCRARRVGYDLWRESLHQHTVHPA